jgi:predicted translin family RNA/ssDNA-binding protein
MVNRQTREELNALSQEVFGASSRWQKLLNNGYAQLVTEEIDEVVPGENGEPDTTKKVEVPVKRADGALQYTTEYHTVDSVREYMLDLKKKQEEMRALIAKMQEEKRQKENQKKLEEAVQQDIGGNALA